MSVLAKVWQGFLRLFGLNTCAVPPVAARPATPRERATRARLEQVLRRD